MAEPIASRSAARNAERARLRRALCRALEQAEPEIRVLAEGVLAEASPMDLLAVGPEGELIAVRMAEEGDDLAMLTRLLADLSWLRPRREDYLKLATGNGIDPSAEPRGLLIAPSIGRETRAAVDNFPADTVQLWLDRPGRAGDRAGLRIERIDPTGRPSGFPSRSDAQAFEDDGRAGATPSPHPPESRAWTRRSGLSASPRPAAPSGTGFRRTTQAIEADPGDRPLTDPPSPSAFRTGLCAGDLAGSTRPNGEDRARAESRLEPLDAVDRPAPGNPTGSGAIFRHG